MFIYLFNQSVQAIASEKMEFNGFMVAMEDDGAAHGATHIRRLLR
jgi:hypothetical protein